MKFEVDSFSSLKDVAHTKIQRENLSKGNYLTDKADRVMVLVYYTSQQCALSVYEGSS